MDSILTALYNGDIYPLEDVIKNQGGIDYEAMIEKYTGSLRSKLSKEDSVILEDLCECMQHLRYDTNELYFKEGFKLASMLMAEVYAAD